MWQAVTDAVGAEARDALWSHPDLRAHERRTSTTRPPSSRACTAGGRRSPTTSTARSRTCSATTRASGRTEASARLPDRGRCGRPAPRRRGTAARCRAWCCRLDPALARRLAHPLERAARRRPARVVVLDDVSDGAGAAARRPRRRRQRAGARDALRRGARRASAMPLLAAARPRARRAGCRRRAADRRGLAGSGRSAARSCPCSPRAGCSVIAGRRRSATCATRARTCAVATGHFVLDPELHALLAAARRAAPAGRARATPPCTIGPLVEPGARPVPAAASSCTGATPIRRGRRSPSQLLGRRSRAESAVLLAEAAAARGADGARAAVRGRGRPRRSAADRCGDGGSARGAPGARTRSAGVAASRGSRSRPVSRGRPGTGWAGAARGDCSPTRDHD